MKSFLSFKSRKAFSFEGRIGRAMSPILLAGGLFAAGEPAQALDLPRRLPSPEEIAAIAQTFASPPVSRGVAVGVGGAILIADRPPVFFSYGLSDAKSKTAFSVDRYFQIGSVTKVFTTNLLAQSALFGSLGLNTPLGALPAEISGFDDPLMKKVTLKYLADFTSGLPDQAPECKSGQTPKTDGCKPDTRPSIAEYGIEDFVKFFKRVKLKNYQSKPDATPISRLPAPYEYSDFSVGLLGLILGADPKTPLSLNALNGWVNLLNQQLLQPLGMAHTYLPLDSMPAPLGTAANGYRLATAHVDPSDVTAEGAITKVTLDQPGANYSSVPTLSIVGGNGTGAHAEAKLFCSLDPTNCAVSSVIVSDQGRDYIAPPVITISCAAKDTACQAQQLTGPTVTAIISGGAIVGAMIQGSKNSPAYTVPPTVTIAGGRTKSGRDATAKAQIAHGALTFIRIEDGGAGYVDPLSVVIQPPDPVKNPVPIWAPAGALQSTVEDISVFVAAALGRTTAGMKFVKPQITAGFVLAETPRACQKGTNEFFPICVDGLEAPRVGLSWDVVPGDLANNYPVIVSKNGGLPGYSTQVDLMPFKDLGVVVFVNSFDIDNDVATDSSKSSDKPTGEAAIIARNILNAVYYAMTGK